MTTHDQEQALLLEIYCATLEHDPNAPPPADLDPELGNIARRFARQAAPDPDDAVLAALRRRVLGGAVPVAPAAPARWDLRRWPRLLFATARSMPSPRSARRGVLPFIIRAGNALAVTLLIAVTIGTLALVMPAGRGQPTPGNGSGSAAVGTLDQVAAATPAPCLTPTPPTPTVSTVGAAATVTAGAAWTATVVVRPTNTPVTPPAGSVTLEQAVAVVRAFLGEPDATFDAGYTEVVSATRGGPVGYLVWLRKRVSGGPTRPDSFNVDAATGELTAANFQSNETPCAPEQPIDDAEAQSRAEDFARARFPGFDRLTRREQPRYHAPGSVSWQLRASADGAWLPTRVQVKVSLTTGRVTNYSQHRLEYAGPTTPRLSAAEASDLALAEVRKDVGQTNVAVAETTLSVVSPYSINRTQTESRLVWEVELTSGRQMLYVDALTGEILIADPKG